MRVEQEECFHAPVLLPTLVEFLHTSTERQLYNVCNPVDQSKPRPVPHAKVQGGTRLDGKLIRHSGAIDGGLVWLTFAIMYLCSIGSGDSQSMWT